MHLNIQGTKHRIRPGISLIGSVQNERYNTILLQDRSICPKHASLRFDTATNKLQILDLCSIHGVTVNQKPIAPLTWIEISTQCRLHLGNVLASVEIDNKNKVDDMSFLQDEDSTDVIDCSLEEAQPLQSIRKNTHTAVSVLATSGRRSSLVETTATVHEPPGTSSEGRRSSFFVPETQQLDSTCTKPNETPIPNDDHCLEKDDDDDELFFIPETQQPEDALGCASDVIKPILPYAQATEQPTSEEEYFQMTVENDDNSNDAMFNNKYVEQSQNLMQHLDISYSGAVVPRVSMLPDRSVDSISMQEQRSTTMEMSRIEWNESKNENQEQSMIDERLRKPKARKEVLERQGEISEEVGDRSITPELNFDNDPPVATVEKQTSVVQDKRLQQPKERGEVPGKERADCRSITPELNFDNDPAVETVGKQTSAVQDISNKKFKNGSDVDNCSTEKNQPPEQANRSSKTPEFCFDEQENEDDEHEISLNQEGCNNRLSSVKSKHDLVVTNVYDMETQAFDVDDHYELLTQPLERLEKKSKSSAQKLQSEDPYGLLTQPLAVEKPCTSKLSENSTFIKPKHPVAQRISDPSPEIDYANMPTQQFTPPELLYQPTGSCNDGSSVTEKGATNALIAGNDSPCADSKRKSSFEKQTCAVALSTSNHTPEIDYANLPTQLFTPPELLFQPSIAPTDSNNEPLPTSAISIDDEDLLTQPLSPPKELMDTPVLYGKSNNKASSTSTAYDLDTQPFNPHTKKSNERFSKKNPVLKLVDIKTCHLSNPIARNSMEIVSDVDENVYDLGKLKFLENVTLPENEISGFNPQINSTARISLGPQKEGQQHKESCIEISPSTSNKENSTKEADERSESFDTEDELCLAATLPIGNLFPTTMTTECVEHADVGVSAKKFKIPLVKTDTQATPKAMRNRKGSNAEMTEFLTPEHPLLYLPKADCIRSVSEKMREQNTTYALAIKGKPKYHFNDSSDSSSDDDGAANRQSFKKTNISVALQKELENVREVGKLKKQQGLTDRGKVQPKKDDEVEAQNEGRSNRKPSTSVQQKEAEGLEKKQAVSRETSTRRKKTKDIEKTSEPKNKSNRTTIKDKKTEPSKQTYNESETRQERKSSDARSSSDRSKSSDVIVKRVSTRNRVETYKKRMLNESIDYLSESTEKPSTVSLTTRAGRKRKEQLSTDREKSNAADAESKRYKPGQSGTTVAPEVEAQERLRRATSRNKKVVGSSSDLFVEQGKTSGLIRGVLGYDSATSSTGSDASTASATRSYRPRLIFTKMSPEPYRNCIARAGGKIVDIPELANILVTDRIIRTYKFLCSVAKGIPIVGQSYLDALQNSDGKEHIDAWDHILSDPVKEKRYAFRLRDTLLKAKQHKLFQDYTVFVTSSTQPPPSELYLILSCAGAKISKHCSQPPKDTNKMFVISDPADSASWVKYREKFPTIEVVSAEGFMLSIMQHSIKFQKYRLM